MPCNPDLAYSTKGHRDKRLPLFDPMARLLGASTPGQGLLLVRRRVHEGQERPPLLGYSLQQLAESLENRTRGCTGMAARQAMRDLILREAGALSYDQVQSEFRKVAAGLHWSARATLKDFRHLFASSLANAGMPEPYRQYIMGHATSGAVIGVYTHLNKIREHYLAALEKEWPSLLEVVRERAPQ